MVTDLEVSNMVKEWCAHAVIAIGKATANSLSKVRFMAPSSVQKYCNLRNLNTLITCMQCRGKTELRMPTAPEREGWPTSHGGEGAAQGRRSGAAKASSHGKTGCST